MVDFVYLFFFCSLRILCVTKSKQKDKQSSAMLEKKTRAETEARLCVEKQLAELQAQKAEEAASAARSLSSRYPTSKCFPCHGRLRAAQVFTALHWRPLSKSAGSLLGSQQDLLQEESPVKALCGKFSVHVWARRPP